MASRTPSEWLTATQVAAALGIQIRTASRWLNRGVIPGRKIGGRWFVHRSVLESLRESCAVELATASNSGTLGY